MLGSVWRRRKMLFAGAAGGNRGDSAGRRRVTALSGAGSRRVDRDSGRVLPPPASRAHPHSAAAARSDGAGAGAAHRSAASRTPLHPEAEFPNLVLPRRRQPEQAAHHGRAGQDAREPSGLCQSQNRSHKSVSVDLQRRRPRRLAIRLGARFRRRRERATGRVHGRTQGLDGGSQRRTGHAGALRSRYAENSFAIENAAPAASPR